MASRAQRRKNLIQIVALVIAVVVVITASVLFQNWWNNRPGPQPAEVAISVSNGSEQVEVTPYSVCEPGVECAENEVPVVPVPSDGTMTLTLPKEIYDHDWALLKIYDDPAANSEAYYTSNQATEVTIPGSVDPTT
ncbi:DUF2771 domain-containing protein, partial [Corynebacterium sp. 35RC1]|nr:DUF2771 domain-containing protein [Corynebacterium sp. 35RC1]